MAKSTKNTIINQNDQLTGTQVVEFCTTLEQALKSALAPQIGKRITSKFQKSLFQVIGTKIDMKKFQTTINTMLKSKEPLNTFASFNYDTQTVIIDTLENNKSYFTNLLQTYVDKNHIHSDYIKNSSSTRFMFDDKGNITFDKLITTLKSVLPNQTQSSLETKESLTKPGFHGIITPDLLRKKYQKKNLLFPPTYIYVDDKYTDENNQPVDKEIVGKQPISFIKMSIKNTMTGQDDIRERVFIRNEDTIQKLYIDVFGREYKTFKKGQTQKATTYIKDKIFQKYNNDPQFTKAFEIKDWFYYNNMSQSDRITLRTLIAKYQQDCNIEGIFPGFKFSVGVHWGAGSNLFLRLPVSVDGFPVYLGSTSGESGLDHGGASNAHPFAC